MHNPYKLNKNKSKTEHKKAKSHGRKPQKRNCSTHNQKPTRHPNTSANKQRTSMGIQNKKANRSFFRTENTPRSPIPAVTETGTQRTNHKPKTATRKTHKKSIHHNRERKNIHRKILQLDK